MIGFEGPIVWVRQASWYGSLLSSHVCFFCHNWSCSWLWMMMLPVKSLHKSLQQVILTYLSNPICRLIFHTWSIWEWYRALWPCFSPSRAPKKRQTTFVRKAEKMPPRPRNGPDTPVPWSLRCRDGWSVGPPRYKKHRKTIGKSGNSWDLWLIYDSVQLVPISPRTLVYDTQITNI